MSTAGDSARTLRTGRGAPCRLFSLRRLAWRRVEIRADRPFWLRPGSGLTGGSRRLYLCSAWRQAEPWNAQNFPCTRRPAQPRPPGMTGHPCRESPARPNGPRRPARTGGSGPPGRRGRAGGWTRIRRLGPGCPRAPRAFRPGPGRVPGTDQPYNVDHGEYQHHRRGDEQNPEAEIGHQACLPSAGNGPYTGEALPGMFLSREGQNSGTIDYQQTSTGARTWSTRRSSRSRSRRSTGC